MRPGECGAFSALFKSLNLIRLTFRQDRGIMICNQCQQHMFRTLFYIAGIAVFFTVMVYIIDMKVDIAKLQKDFDYVVKVLEK